MAALGGDGETWVGDGVKILSQTAESQICPFCAQDLSGSTVIEHYRSYFSEAYEELKRRIAATSEDYDRILHGDEIGNFERAVSGTSELKDIWEQFCEIPEFSVDTASIARDWQVARDVVSKVFAAKQAAPLERIVISEGDLDAIEKFGECQKIITNLNDGLEQANSAIAEVKERSKSDDPEEAQRILSDLRACNSRHSPTIDALCIEWLAEQTAKTATENQRRQARIALDNYRTAVFPEYQSAINDYLASFNAGFQVADVGSANTRAGSACVYALVIDDTQVMVAGGGPTPGEPVFGNTLSSGDRNALALAFFFVSLDRDAELANKIVVIDDPTTSLDDHRHLVTVQRMRRLSGETAQLIILSHKKHFLCSMSQLGNSEFRSALQLIPNGASSSLTSWDVDEASATEHDLRHTRLRQYLKTRTGNTREIAEDIRPLLEAYLRVACATDFPPGSLIGQFLRRCNQRLGTSDEILSQSAINELENLNEYSSKYHHETNPAYATETINEGELNGYVERALIFTSPAS